jgi:hypothetical protein
MPRISRSSWLRRGLICTFSGPSFISLLVSSSRIGQSPFLEPWHFDQNMINPGRMNASLCHLWRYPRRRWLGQRRPIRADYSISGIFIPGAGSKGMKMGVWQCSLPDPSNMREARRIQYVPCRSDLVLLLVNYSLSKMGCARATR